MKISSVGTLAAVLAIQKASASWLTEDCFPKPSSCDNQCTDEQRGGWHWSGLTPGLPFSSFDGYDFSGFTCSDKQGGWGKRSSDKCISGSISKSGSDSGPRISCSEDKDAFSITSFSVYAEEETDVVFSYGMPDGSQCQHTSTCGPEGTDVSNDQCGGAISVSWSIPDYSGVDSCGFGIYSIGFDCTPGEGNHKHTTVPGNSYTIPPASVTVPAVSVPTFSVPDISVPPFSVPDISVTIPWVSIPDTSVTIPAVSIPSNTPSVPSFSISVPSGSFSVSIPAVTGPTGPVPGVSSTAVVPPSPTVTPQSYTTSTVWTTTLVTVTSCAPTVTNCPANSQSVITKTVALSTTICPVTATETGVAVPTGGSSPSVTSVAPVGTSIPGTTPGSTPGSTPGGSCPSVVPKCINTWMPDTCTDNTDVSCYCPSSNVTSSIISCIQSWGADSSEISSALSYFTGICSGYIPGNPGIITAVPTTIPLTPPAAESTVAPAGGSVPCTTITYASTTYTVPQVAFTTTTATEVGGATTAVVGLIPATTAPAVVAPAPTGNPAPAPAGGVSTLATTVVGVAGPTGVIPTKSSPSSTLPPFTGAAVAGAVVSKEGIMLGGVMGLLAMLI